MNVIAPLVDISQSQLITRNFDARDTKQICFTSKTLAQTLFRLSRDSSARAFFQLISEFFIVLHVCVNFSNGKHESFPSSTASRKFKVVSLRILVYARQSRHS